MANRMQWWKIPGAVTSGTCMCYLVADQELGKGYPYRVLLGNPRGLMSIET